MHAHVYAFFAATIGSDFYGGDKEGFRGGERCDYNSTRFRVVWEWVKTSQSVRRAGKSMFGTGGTLLRARLNDCVIDAWL